MDADGEISSSWDTSKPRRLETFFSQCSHTKTAQLSPMHGAGTEAGGMVGHIFVKISLFHPQQILIEAILFCGLGKLKRLRKQQTLYLRIWT